jgi:hypothetical protein
MPLDHTIPDVVGVCRAQREWARAAELEKRRGDAIQSLHVAKDPPYVPLHDRILLRTESKQLGG